MKKLQNASHDKHKYQIHIFIQFNRLLNCTMFMIWWLDRFKSSYIPYPTVTWLQLFDLDSLQSCTFSSSNSSVVSNTSSHILKPRILKIDHDPSRRPRNATHKSTQDNKPQRTTHKATKRNARRQTTTNNTQSNQTQHKSMQRTNQRKTKKHNEQHTKQPNATQDNKKQRTPHKATKRNTNQCNAQIKARLQITTNNKHTKQPNAMQDAKPRNS